MGNVYTSITEVENLRPLINNMHTILRTELVIVHLQIEVVVMLMKKMTSILFLKNEKVILFLTEKGNTILSIKM